MLAKEGKQYGYTFQRPRSVLFVRNRPSREATHWTPEFFFDSEAPQIASCAVDFHPQAVALLHSNQFCENRFLLENPGGFRQPMIALHNIVFALHNS